MSSSESELEDSYNDPELGDFIVDDDPNEVETEKQKQIPTEHPPIDRITQMTSQLKPNETQTRKLLKAHIAVLVSALGGIDHTSTQSPPPYKLGHDALACLKDLRRWIKSVDETNNTYDVALACAESGLVINDLIVILCQWENQSRAKQPIKNIRTTERIMLACLELLVLLTWPVELNDESSVNQKLLYSDIKKHQLLYKKALLSVNNGQTLKAVLRLALPTLAKDKSDREPRDNAVLRLVLFFFRNVLFIEPARSSFASKNSSVKAPTLVDNLPSGITLDDISINVVLSTFKKHKVLMFLLTISNLIGSEFDKELFGPVCIESVYLLLRGVNPSDLLHHKYNITSTSNSNSTNASTNASTSTTSGMQLQNLLQKEADKSKAHSQNLSTRHGRFGTLLSIRGGDSNGYVVSGQEALRDMGATLDKLDKSKKWKNRNTFKYDSDEFISSKTDYLTTTGNELLYAFVNDFLVGGCFNNLIESVGSILTSNSSDFSAVNEYEKAVYFLMIAWFFHFKRERNTLYSKGLISETVADDNDGVDKFNYGSVGAGLSEVNFILIISYFRSSYDLRLWSSLHVAMACFRELLLISHASFAKSKQQQQQQEPADDEQDDIDRELAEGIIRKLFSFNFFINLIIQVLHTASNHSPDYLSVCVSVIHILLKSFEGFANEDIKIYVQHKRRQSKRNKKSINNLDKETENQLRDIIDGSDEEEANERIQEISKERQLDFKQTELRFFHTSIISTYIEYLSRYEDLTHEDIKRCISYFHRLFVIRKDFGGLYRLDFMQTLQRLRNYLPKHSSVRNHVDEFIYYFMKRFKLALSRFPNSIELLFPRFEEIGFKTYLTTGELHIKEDKHHRSTSIKVGRELEFTRDNFSDDEKIKILVTAIYDIETIRPFLSWYVLQLKSIVQQRLVSDTDTVYSLNQSKFDKFILENSYVRLLLYLTGFEVPLIVDQPCKLKASIESSALTEKIALIEKWIQQQPAMFEDNKDPSYFVRQKEWADDEYDEEVDEQYDGDGYGDDDDEPIAFETRADPNADRTNAHELDTLDELERSLQASQGSGSQRGRGSKGKALKKKQQKQKQKQTTTKRKSATHHRRRPPRSLGIESGDEAPLKSSEFVHDSDDESDDEKVQEFFTREERLRRMLSESGGIVNPQQLDEFKKVWQQLETGSGSAPRVALERSRSSLFVESLHEDDNDNDDEADQPSAPSSQMMQSDSETERVVDENSQTSEEDDTVTKPSKRQRGTIDSEEEDEDEDTFVSASEAPTRKRRLVIDDEDE
ncbi:topoisomerase 1-associated factor 1 [Scheffersomyces amazonensis]|uniref:topoisomerase 1-associated factor 1 n=1 Tax=Scheffersomyces amazonensis TaxID=1078765 RepID=UPI00315C9D5C